MNHLVSRPHIGLFNIIDNLVNIFLQDRNVAGNLRYILEVSVHAADSRLEAHAPGRTRRVDVTFRRCEPVESRETCEHRQPNTPHVEALTGSDFRCLPSTSGAARQLKTEVEALRVETWGHQGNVERWKPTCRPNYKITVQKRTRLLNNKFYVV